MRVSLVAFRRCLLVYLPKAGARTGAGLRMRPQKRLYKVGVGELPLLIEASRGLLVSLLYPRFIRGFM